MKKYTSEEYEFAIRMLHHRKELSSEEAEEWMKDPDHLELLEEMAAVRRIAGEVPMKVLADGPRRVHRRFYRGRMFKLGVAAAASVLICLGAWQLLKGPVRQEVAPTVAQVQIEPGGAKARLLLPGGKVVGLLARGQEITVSEQQTIRNDSLEGLTYRQDNPVVGSGEEHILQVPLGGFYKLELSDGTKVWLNAGSELRYPVQFSGADRNVYLKGEGYFEVARNERMPFHVVMQQATVTVLGTSFNISAYPEENKVLTTLVNGAVRFYSDKTAKDVVLKPGEQFVLDTESGKTTLAEVDTKQYTAWIDGRFIFRDMPLEAIMRQLERWYDFRITYVQPEIRSDKFRGVIQRDTRIEDVFKAIELTMDVRFTIDGKQVTVEKR